MMYTRVYAYLYYNQSSLFHSRTIDYRRIIIVIELLYSLPLFVNYYIPDMFIGLYLYFESIYVLN